MLLEIGFPMYEANGDGHSILIEIIGKYIKDQIAEEIFKLLITKYGFDVLLSTTAKSNLPNLT